MSRSEQDPQAVEVIAISSESTNERSRVGADTPFALIDLVRDAPDAALLLVDIDAAFTSDDGDPLSGPEQDLDEFIALAAVLVHDGVRAFKTKHPRVVNRVLSMNAAMETGSIEVFG